MISLINGGRVAQRHVLERCAIARTKRITRMITVMSTGKTARSPTATKASSIMSCVQSDFNVFARRKSFNACATFSNLATSPTTSSPSDESSSTSNSSTNRNTEDDHHLILHRSASKDEFGQVDEIPHDVRKLLKPYYSRQQTRASLQMLVRTGRDEFLGKAFSIREPNPTPAPPRTADSNYVGVGAGRSSLSRLRGASTYSQSRQHRGAFIGEPSTASQDQAVILKMASFLADEIPLRLAHRIRDLDYVPLMRDMPSVQQVKGIYIHSFLECINHRPVIDAASEESFAQLVEKIYTKHANVLVKMAKGAFELRTAVRAGLITGRHDDSLSDPACVEFERMEQCHRFLDRFYSSRIGIRVLIAQYLLMRRQPTPPDYVGMICLKTSPSTVVRKSADDAISMCMRRYNRAPKVEITGRLDLTFPYIPTYLHYILLELLKNALRATCEHHADKETLPPVTVVIADGTENEDVAIKIMDVGGGIPRSQMEKIWSYLFTTADAKVQEAFIAASDHSKESPIAGLGYGLPIARSYCRYFGGDIDLVSLEGYGTDAFVYLKRLGDVKEPVPKLPWDKLQHATAPWAEQPQQQVQGPPLLELPKLQQQEEELQPVVFDEDQPQVQPA